MISIPETVIEKIGFAVGEKILDVATLVSPETIAATGFKTQHITEKTLFEMVREAIADLGEFDHSQIGGVIATTFSNEERFPALAVRVATEIGIEGCGIPAYDIQMACSAYPYALMAATRLAADTGKKVLVIDADIQSRYAKSAATRAVMGDAATATIVSAQKDGKSYYDFFSRADDALRCRDEIVMDGFKVFSFVAREVSGWLKEFIARLGEGERDFQFVPHQANMYMVRQLANALNLSDKLLVSGDEFGNVGSSSIPLTLATRACAGRALVAGFGAGLSAAAALVRLADGFKGRQ